MALKESFENTSDYNKNVKGRTFVSIGLLTSIADILNGLPYELGALSIV